MALIEKRPPRGCWAPEAFDRTVRRKISHGRPRDMSDGLGPGKTCREQDSTKRNRLAQCTTGTGFDRCEMARNVKAEKSSPPRLQPRSAVNDRDVPHRPRAKLSRSSALLTKNFSFVSIRVHSWLHSRSPFLVPIRHRDESRLSSLVPVCGQNDFQWVFLKVWLSRLISGC